MRKQAAAVEVARSTAEVAAEIALIRASTAKRARAENRDFRDDTKTRLSLLENDVHEIKQRVNGILFLAAGSVIAQVILRVAHL